MATQSLASKIDAAQVFIENTLADPELLATFASAGRDVAYFEAARALYLRVRELHARQQAKYGDQKAATQAAREAHVAANEVYRRHIGLARIAFKHDTRAVQALGLDARRERGRADWLDQATLFYLNLTSDPASVAGLSQLGVPEAEWRGSVAIFVGLAFLRRRRLSPCRKNTSG